MALRAKRYDEIERALQADPIVHEMAAELPRGYRKRDLDLFHEDGTPTSRFMARANAEYKRRGGTCEIGHLGAVANAIRNLREAVAAATRSELTEPIRAELRRQGVAESDPRK